MCLNVSSIRKKSQLVDNWCQFKDFDKCFYFYNRFPWFQYVGENAVYPNGGIRGVGPGGLGDRPHARPANPRNPRRREPHPLTGPVYHRSAPGGYYRRQRWVHPRWIWNQIGIYPAYGKGRARTFGCPWSSRELAEYFVFTLFNRFRIWIYVTSQHITLNAFFSHENYIFLQYDYSSIFWEAMLSIEIRKKKRSIFRLCVVFLSGVVQGYSSHWAKYLQRLDTHVLFCVFFILMTVFPGFFFWKVLFWGKMCSFFLLNLQFFPGKYHYSEGFGHKGAKFLSKFVILY